MHDALTEPAFTLQGEVLATLVLWQTSDQEGWLAAALETEDGTEDDGGVWMFEPVDGAATSYVAYALDYFEQALDPKAVDHVMRYQPVGVDHVRILNPDANIEALVSDLAQIGYPAAIETVEPR